MNIEIKKSSETICTCNSCGARNYETKNDFVKITTRKVDTMYEVRIGCMVSRLCPDCLDVLIGKAIMIKEL